MNQNNQSGTISVASSQQYIWWTSRWVRILWSTSTRQVGVGSRELRGLSVDSCLQGLTFRLQITVLSFLGDFIQIRVNISRYSCTPTSGLSVVYQRFTKARTKIPKYFAFDDVFVCDYSLLLLLCDYFKLHIHTHYSTIYTS